MLKPALFGLMAAVASVAAFASADCVKHPQNEQIAPAKFQQQLQESVQ